MKIMDWLRAHSLINISALERTAGVPANTLKFALSGLRPLPAKYLPALEKVLREYGYRP